MSLRILYIEDDPVDANFINRLASEINEFSFLDTEKSLLDGVIKLGDSNYDCVFLDLSLPDSFGISTVDAVRIAQPHVPIIVFTGLNDQDLALKAIKRGAQDYLVKGDITKKLLKKSVFYAIERNKNDRQLKLAQKISQKLKN